MSTATLPLPAEPPASSGPALADKARSGVLWVTGLNVFRDILQFATMLVLVRLLAPKAYGEFSLITSVMVFFTISFGPVDPCGLWQSTQLMADSGSRCLYGRWKLAHTSWWQPAQSLLIG